MDLNTWLLIGLIILWLLLFIVGRTRDQIARMERKLDAVLKSAGINVADLADKEALALLQANKKVEAIKAYREYTGATLAAAKEHVENLQKTSNRNG